MSSDNPLDGSLRDSDPRQADHNQAIRASYLSGEELHERGQRLAREAVVQLPGYESFDFFRRHRENEKEILAAYRSIASDVDAGAQITPAAEWLLDNHYVVEEAIQQARRDLPGQFYNQLPVVDVGGEKIPRVLALAWIYVAHTHSVVSSETLTHLVGGFQDGQVLEIGELWALPSFIRFVLIENLRRVAVRVEHSRRMRRRANETADAIIRGSDEAAGRQLLAEAEDVSNDTSFATQFLYRMRNAAQPAGFAVAWMEARLERTGTNPDLVMQAEHNRLSSGNVTMGNIIRSLREIDDTEWSIWFEEVSHIDRILSARSDFSALDFGSRNTYRNRIEQIARRSRRSEVEVAQTVLRLSEEAAAREANEREVNIGAFLVGRRRRKLEEAVGYRQLPVQKAVRLIRRLNWFAIAGPVMLLTVLFVALAGFFLFQTDIPPVVVVLLLLMFSLPASEGATGLFNTIVTFVVRPARLVGYEFKQGIPAEARTLVAVPCLIGNRDSVDELVRNLEVHYLANPHGEIYFSLISDWRDSAIEQSEADLELFDYAKGEIAALNAKYGFADAPRFYFLHRRRLYNPGEGAWMGWERKRGKLHELNMLLRGDRDTTFLPGAAQVPEGVQYVMTLDADTRLMRDAVTKLVGKMHHPINRPVLDPKRRRVGLGYGVMQPRVTPSLTTGKEASVFQRVFSVGRGLDPYVFTVSDVYQDLTGEGSFTGKGLYHVDAFEAALKGRIDENTVLSHDLLEGSFARCALVTDVELVEDFPTRYEVEVSRQHRWARGDWQLLPYILDPKRGVTALGRWKMVDNLRRSLTPIAWFFASVLGWYFMDVLGALIWQILLIFSLFVAPTLSLLRGFLPASTDIVPSAHFASVWSEIRSANAQVALRVVFIADSACIMTDAIARSLYRLFFSRRLMLEWRTAASIQSSAQGSPLDYYRSMWHAPVIAVLALMLAALPGDNAFLVGIPFALLWILSPLIAWYVSQSAETEDRLFVPETVSVELRKIARRTWRYFESFVTAEQNHLPPDNFQEDPRPLVAARTSPTNIGVYLLSVISARHFGWISFAETVERLERSVETLDRMEKYRGHLYNWYHTDTLATLGPRYVSAVDSGNLAGHLIAISSACRVWSEAPSAHLQGNLDGIGDVAGILREALAALPDDRKTVRPLRRRLEERIGGFANALAAVKREHEFASIRVINLSVLARDIQKLAGNLNHEMRSGRSEEVVRWSESLVAVCEAHIADSVFDNTNIEQLRRRLAALAARSRDIAFSMDFSLLYNKDRRLLSIGYRADERELDQACYDLLASECRLTSLFAIAKGDLPTEHWYRLGRQVVPVGARGALVSWSGSMFEYLMPPLVMQERQGGILNQTNNLVVREQISYGRRLGTPWGVSEAAFNARDHLFNYQYTNFGVPTLGLKRGLGQNAVIAPYASILASQYDPEAALDNLFALRDLGALGKYGYHDAVDFTPTRVPDGKRCAVVRNYYAHHHGMSIAAIANVVHNGLLRELFHADPVVEAAELLLQEKAPREIPVMSARPQEKPGDSQDDLLRPEIRTIDNPAFADRELTLLSNGNYSVMLTATGAGYSRWNGLAVARWKPDPTEDRNGQFLFLRDIGSSEWWSATAEPRRAAGEVARTVFSDDRAEFHKSVGDLTSTVECIVASEHDAEGRRLTLQNAGQEDRFIEVTSYLEPVLGRAEDDDAHPAFSRMFLRTEISRRGDVIRAWRNSREATAEEVVMAHLAADHAGLPRQTEFETDRRRFIGRGRSLADAAAFDAGAVLSGSDGFTLDPVLSLRRVLRVPAGKKVSMVFWTIAAANRDRLDQAIERYRNPDAFQVELTQAWTRSQMQLRHLGINSQQAAGFQHLARYLIYPDLRLRADQETVRNHLQPQSALWPFAISGDLPIVTLRINDEADLAVAREAISAHEYLSARGVGADLVIFNERASSYAQEMQHAIDHVSETSRRAGQQEGQRGRVFTVRRDIADDSGWEGLIAASRVVLHAANGKIVDQLGRAAGLYAQAAETSRENAAAGLPAVAALPVPQEAPEGVAFWNGFGGFSAHGDEYVIRLSSGQATPQPWINVIANAHFGFHVSAEGAGFTWSGNSRDYPLTPWSNDAVTNRPGEGFYLADLDSGAVLTPLAGLSQRRDVSFEIRHGLGYSVFSSAQDGLDLRLTQTVDRDRPVKLSAFRIRNDGAQARKLRLYAHAEWQLGANGERSRPFILSERDEASGAIVATNPFGIDHRRFAFLALSEAVSGFTASRREFIGRFGSPQAPAAVTGAQALSGGLDPEGDPLAALSADIVLAPGEEKEIVIYLGDSASREEAAALVSVLRGEKFGDILSATQSFWGDFTGRLQVSTPDKGFDHLVNRWLPYQAYGCRIMARAAFYQASGAFGFRDQLQDSLGLILLEPALARGQLLRAAGRQFREGDVQHWWLPETGAGVRTLISDDVVWLAHAAHLYVCVTGERSILDEEIAFIEGPALEPGQHDSFFTPQVSGETASLYEHAARALDLAIARTGSKGLPLILGGDWNDGMNRVGIEGRGMSVWLGWFLAATLKDFLGFAAEREDRQRVERWSAHLSQLRQALETEGWDGDWYRRGFYDDGTPLGSAQSEECRIDSLSQSWSVLSGEGDAERAGKAMDAVLEKLVNEEAGIIQLFDPPFGSTAMDPGYIRAYPPGVRENGGQYTHAAIWVVLALARLGRGDDAWKCFSLINPVNHALTREAAEHYRVEPYVVAADVYGGGGDYAGRGGWSWYTGSAGWLYRAAVEGILGISRRGDRLFVDPVLPSQWDGYSADLAIGGRRYRIEAKQSEVSINGTVVQAGEGYPLAGSGSD